MIFDYGQEQSIEQILTHKEQRLLFQENLLNQFSNYTLISYTLNIPGPIKNNEFLLALFDKGLSQIMDYLTTNNLKIIYQKQIHLPSGNDCFIIVDCSPVNLKKQLVGLEEATSVGRLFDLDVLFKRQKRLTQIGRSELGLKPRTCLICHNEAKLCGRSREHAVEVLQTKINQIYEEMGHSYGDEHQKNSTTSTTCPPI